MGTISVSQFTVKQERHHDFCHFCQFLLWQDVNLAPTESAGDPDADVLLRKTQFLLTMGALGVNIGLDDGRVSGIQTKIGCAEFALHALAKILPVNLQFLRALGAGDKHACWRDFNHGIDLLQWYECGDLDTIAL